MRLDLHLHTSCSDGLLSPAELVAAARAASLDVIAITDHDTLAAVPPAQSAAARLGGVRVIPAIELSCSFRGADLHLLGYGVQCEHAELASRSLALAERRQARVGEIVARLNGLGVAIAPADVTVPAGNASVGRPHVAQALVRLGRVGSIHEAFARWLSDGGPAYVPSAGPDVADGIAMVLAAGGCPVWAHPSLADARYFGSLRDAGLEGIEALRPSQPPTDSAAIEHAARAVGLFVTGGSDWHGGQRPALGSWYVTEKHVAAFLRHIGLVVD